MKKLMIAALAVASVGAAYASDACGYITPDTAWVYKWTFTGKTTKPAEAKVKIAASACGEAPETCAVRTPTSLKIQGYTWICSPGCGDQFGEFSEVNEIFWSTKPENDSFAGGLANEIFHIIGRNAKQAEVAGTADLTGAGMRYEFTYAGLGKYDTKNRRLKAAKGNFAGYAYHENCLTSAVWNCDPLTINCGENPATVAYGKFKVRFQKSASKKFAKVGKLPTFPKWVEYKNGN
jgi:hypothetical protein